MAGPNVPRLVSTLVCQAWLRRRYVETVEAAEDRPVLCSYQADGTSALTKVYRALKLGTQPCGRRVRVGASCKEFYIERALVCFENS